MSHSSLFSHHLQNKQFSTLKKTPVESVILSMLFRNPSQIKLSLLLAHPGAAFHYLSEVGQSLYSASEHDVSDEYSGHQLQTVRTVAYVFSRNLLNPSVLLSVKDIISPSQFYDSKDGGDEKRKQSFAFLRCTKQDYPIDVKPVDDFLSQHPNKHIIQLCWICLFFRVKIDDPLFVALFAYLPQTVLFFFYRSLVSEFGAASLEDQDIWAIYSDHFTLMLQNLEVEKVRSLKPTISQVTSLPTAGDNLEFASGATPGHTAGLNSGATKFDTVVLEQDSNTQEEKSVKSTSMTSVMLYGTRAQI